MAIEDRPRIHVIYDPTGRLEVGNQAVRHELGLKTAMLSLNPETVGSDLGRVAYKLTDMLMQQVFPRK